MAQIRSMVEREPVAGHPSGDSDPNRGKLFLADPDAGKAVNSLRGDAVICSGTNQHFLEIPDVAVHVAAIGFQVEDGIADDLSRPVVGDVAAAAGLEDLNAMRREHFRSREDVRPSSVATNAEGQNRRVLDKEQLVRDRLGAAFLNEVSLEG